MLGTEEFYYDFFAIAFTIKNLPTPFYVKPSYPLIKMGIYNGTGFGFGDLISFTNFTATASPEVVSDAGVVFGEELVPSINPKTPIKVMDTFFVP